MLTLEWQGRIEAYRRELKTCIFHELGTIDFEGFTEDTPLTCAEAKKKEFKPMPIGTKWGVPWQYGWFRSQLILPKEADGERIQLSLDLGGETMIYVDGVAIGGTWYPDPIRGSRLHDRSPLTLDAIAGKPYEIIAEVYAGHGPILIGNGPVASSRILLEPKMNLTEVGRSAYGIVNDDVYQLHIDVETLLRLREQLDPNSLRVAEIDAALKDFTRIFDPELPADAMTKTAISARTHLAPLLTCVNGSTMPEFFAFGHAHIDLAWLWPMQHTEHKACITFANQLTLATQYPEYKFLQSQPQLYVMVKKLYPELYKRVKDAVRKGQFIPDGGMWVEPDTNIPSGESLIRQIIYGKKFFKEEFGVENEVLWLPDVFGFSGSLPQIMQGCGLKYFASQKILWNYHGGEKFPYNTFVWEGIDGTGVLAHIYSDYSSHTHPTAIMNKWNNRVQKDHIATLLLPFGYGDGGGGPLRDHLEHLRREKNLEGIPKVRISTPLEFFKDIEKRGVPRTRYVGELYYQAHRGTYTSQAKTKKGNRQSEFALREAELWSNVAATLTKYKFPQEVLHDAWQKVLVNQFHDILPGSSINRVYQEAETTYAEVMKTANRVTADAMKAIAGAGKSMIVFNSLNWERNALVELTHEISNAKPGNKALTKQTVGDKSYVELKLPSCGFIALSTVRQRRLTGDICKATKNSLENDLLKVMFNNRGEITSIYDKVADREVARGVCNRIQMFKDVPSVYDAWDIDSMYKDTPIELVEKASIKTVASGPLFAAVLLTRKLNNSMMTQEIVLRRGKRRIDFKTKIDWQERHKLLKVAFPVDIQSDTALHEIQFGHIKRPNHASRPYDADRFEVCNHKWTALAEENSGCAVINDSKYGVNVTGNSINLTLLRAPVAPDYYADRGEQEFTYSFYTWLGSFAKCELVREAYDLNVPAQVTVGGRKKASFFSVDAENIIIEAVKSAEDDPRDMILRAYESKRMRTDCTLVINVPFSTVWQTDMLENNNRELDHCGNKVKLTLRPFEVVTIRIRK